VRERANVEPRPSTGDPEEERWRLLQAVSGFLRNASSVQPLLLVLEDLHWADRGTLDLMLHVARNLEGARLLVVGTYRDVEVDRAHPLSATLAELRRVSSLPRILLRGLTVDEVHRMYTFIRGQDVSWAQAEAVHRQTEGNPLFVQEVLRYLVEEGLVIREAGRYVLAEGTVPGTGIPEGLRDVVGRRLNRLSEKTNQVLSIAAVMGRDFRLDVLQQVLALPEEEVFVALEEATERAVVEQRHVLGAIAFRFTHAFFRQTLYEEIFAPRRIRIHQQVGRALETVHARRLEEHAAELAEHFAQSTEHDDLEKALHYCELAAQGSMRVFAYGEAVRHLEQALRALEVLDPDDKSRRCDLLLALSEATALAGDPWRAATQMSEEAFTLAEVLQDSSRAAHICTGALDAIYRYAGTAVQIMPEWRTWAERADRHASAGTLSRVYADLARSFVVPGRVMEERALELALEIGDNQAIFQSGNQLLLGGGLNPERWTRAIALSRDLSARSRDGVRSNTLAQALSHCASFLLAFGDRDSAEKIWQEIAVLAEHTRDPYVLLRPTTNLIQKYTLDGNLQAALDASSRLLEGSLASGMVTYGEGEANDLTFRARLYLGRFEEALEYHERSTRIQGSEGSQVGPQPPRLALLYVLLHRDEEAQALLKTQRARNFGSMNLSPVVILLEAAVAFGEVDLASKLTAMLKPVADLVNTRARDLTCVARHLGAASALLGRADEARAYDEQAIDLCGRIRFKPEVALSRLQLAELLLDHYPSERAEAIEHLDFAIAEFREMKMQPSLERALRHRDLLKA
jgi:tetratricopeptide (TPR) repeat protein